MRLRLALALVMATLGTSTAFAQAPATPSSGPYKIVNSARVGGAGGFDYVFADSDGRKLYIPRSNRVTVFDLDTLKSAGEIPNAAGVHGATVDPKTDHGFSSSKPVVMWDTATLKTIKSIDVQGNPDGILFDPFTQHVFILSHSAPNATVIDSRDGTVVGTIDLGGMPEQGASDGAGHLYFDIEDKSNVAVVDAKTLQVTAHYDLAGKGGTPAGLSLDVKNHILFCCCRNPATCVILNADDGKIITTVPIGAGTDGAAFNPDTMEAFSSNRDGTLTVIKEKSPTEFEVLQNVATRTGGKTCTLDRKTGLVYVIALDPTAMPASAAAPATPPASQAATQPGGRGRGRGGPANTDSFSIFVVGH